MNKNQIKQAVSPYMAILTSVFNVSGLPISGPLAELIESALINAYKDGQIATLKSQLESTK